MYYVKSYNCYCIVLHYYYLLNRSTLVHKSRHEELRTREKPKHSRHIYRLSSTHSRLSAGAVKLEIACTDYFISDHSWLKLVLTRSRVGFLDKYTLGRYYYSAHRFSRYFKLLYWSGFLGPYNDFLYCL